MPIATIAKGALLQGWPAGAGDRPFTTAGMKQKDKQPFSFI